MYASTESYVQWNFDLANIDLAKKKARFLANVGGFQEEKKCFLNRGLGTQPNLNKPLTEV